jgi:hypothetical protein
MSLRIDAFNKFLLKTLGSISNKFPDDKDIYFALAQVELSVNISPRLTVEVFLGAIHDYETQIAAKDEHFFLDLFNSDSDEKLNTLKCFELGDKWNTLTNEEKDDLFTKVQKLVFLAKLAIE